MKHNGYGKYLVELSFTIHINILNGRLFQDKESNITCTSGKGVSVLDYCITSTDVFSFYTDFEILDRDDSDDFPVKCTLEFPSKNRCTNLRPISQ